MAAPPRWVKELANQVAVSLQPVEIMSPLGCHYSEQAEHWEITLFASLTEIVGGDKDGETRASRFFVDVLALGEIFTSVSEIHWQPLRMGPDDELGPHLSIQGVFRKKRVWLRVLAKPPERFDTGRQARVYELTWTETW